ncbi:MAG TPA: sugar-binding protein [Candidatus Eremiobacteraceae bacterium]
MVRRAVLLCALLAVTTSTMPAAAADSHIGALTVPQTTVAPPIDGTLDNPAWKNAAVAQLTYDLRDHAAATQATTIYTMSDGTYLYVGIDAKQSIPVRTTEHTNGVGLDTDDEVQVDLWPNGTRGFRYKFTSTAIGTHYQYSTENNSFEPAWSSAGKVVPGGYAITMRIPLSVMHGTGAGDWRIQFIRYMPVTNDAFVWSYGPVQSDFNDVNYSGSLAGLPRLSALRERPRIGVYGLGEIASRRIGGSTSRAGADISIPILPGTSFVGTIHPDYSNVETDQQTIAPTAFQRIFNEVRPFFTQGGNFYSYPNGVCSGCPGIIEFYTPKIPTPSDGYAVEGQRGLFSYGMLHVLSVDRDDTAEALNYVTPDQQTAVNFQGSLVDTPTLHDAADGVTLTHNNLKNFEQFARFGTDSGTNVLDDSQAKRYEAGTGVYSADGANAFAVLRQVGAYFNPEDGIVQHPDIAGYNINFFKPFKYPTTARFTEFDVSGNLDRYHNHAGALDQTDNSLALSLASRTLMSAQLTTGSSYLLLPNNVFSPITQQGGTIAYNNNSSMPTFVSFNTGRFGPGRLNSWTRSSTFRNGTRGAVTLEFDDTDQYLDAGSKSTEWLERFSYSYQSGPNQALALGIRRIIGTPPVLLKPSPGSTLSFEDGWNLSAAFHQKVPGGEVYVVYGDASAFSTSPAFIIKFIRYIGADKGT